MHKSYFQQAYGNIGTVAAQLKKVRVPTDDNVMTVRFLGRYTTPAYHIDIRKMWVNGLLEHNVIGLFKRWIAEAQRVTFNVFTHPK